MRHLHGVYIRPHERRGGNEGAVPTRTELRVQLTKQREPDDSEPLPIVGEPPSAQPLRTGSARHAALVSASGSPN